MRIIALSGSPAALPSLSHLMRARQLAALICPADNPGSETAPLESWAEREGLPCWKIEQHSIEQELSELIRETTPDLLLVYGFPHQLPRHLLQCVKYGAWNVHFSLQPGHKGTITIHQLAGEQVLHQRNVSLMTNDEAGSPFQQLSLISVALLDTSIRSVQRDKSDAKAWSWLTGEC